MPSARVALLLPLLGFPWEQSSPASAPSDPRLAPAAEQEAEARRARIHAEIDKTGAEAGWAGRYYQGDGLGVNVSVEIAPKSGFVFTWHGCGGLYDRNYGTVTETEGRLELSFTFPNARAGFRGLGPVLVPVTWGERRYLIGGDELPAFANDVNGGMEPRKSSWGRGLLRRGDETRPAPGKPELPKQFARLLLDQPVVGSIVTVHETRIEKQGVFPDRVTEATIDRGQEQGLWSGLVVHFDGPGGISGQASVIELADRTARIRIRDVRGERAPVPEVGWTWSTRASWAR